MDILDTIRTQDAVYWPPSSGVDDFGERVYPKPEKLKVRWEDKQQVMRNQKGEEVASFAQVYVGKDLLLHGFLWKGKLRDLAVDIRDNPDQIPTAYEIIRFDVLPILEGEDPLDSDEALRIAWL